MKNSVHIQLVDVDVGALGQFLVAAQTQKASTKKRPKAPKGPKNGEPQLVAANGEAVPTKKPRGRPKTKAA